MTINKITPDKEKAKSLYKMALQTYSMIKTIKESEFPSNIVKEYYDVIRQFIDILLLVKGYKTFGTGSHEECISFAHKEGRLNTTEYVLADDLRKIRNKIEYEGFFVNYDYLKRKKDSIEELLNKLKLLAEKELTIKRAFIIHRWGGNPSSDWYLWLKKKLEGEGFKVTVPEMPDTSEPKIDVWISHLNQVVEELDSETIFIGHSIGCQTIMRFLEKQDLKDKIRKVIFVAGWLKLGNLENKEVEEIAKPWINNPIDFDKVKSKSNNFTVFLSSNEPYGFVKENEALFKDKLGAKVTIEKNKGHFTEDDEVVEIPEVLETIKYIGV
ncbi:MAG: alpha/beta hydrolase [Nanoarchaeota archaeon]